MRRLGLYCASMAAIGLCVTLIAKSKDIDLSRWFYRTFRWG